MARVLKYVFYDILRTRFILFYTIFLMISTFALFQTDGDFGKVVLSMMNIILMVVPLVSVVFSTIHFYNSYEFIELMLAQPVNRRSIFLSEYFGVACSLCLAYLAGVGFPFLLFGGGKQIITLLFTGTFLTLVFVSLAFLSSVLTRDKAKAIGIALLFWFYFSLLYDGILLWIMFSLSDYPLEKLTLSLIALNPIDLARIILLLQLDISALMGYTGAFFKEFFGGYTGIIFSITVLSMWIIVPLLLSVRIFSRKDL